MVTSRRPADLPAFMVAALAVLEDRSHHESGARLAVDADLVALTFGDESLEYMLDMLNRMPAAKDYREGAAPAGLNPAQILRDFASLSDPRGPLEVEPAVIVDVVQTAEGYTARGNARLLNVLESAGVPAVRARN